MKTPILGYAFFAIVASLSFAQAQEGPRPPLKLLATTVVNHGWSGRWDHMNAYDLKGNRIFGASEGGACVEVFDTNTFQNIATIGKGELHEAHSLVFRGDLNRIYVTDGTPKVGALVVFDATDYHLIKRIELPMLADWMSHDDKYCYVNGNGVNNKSSTSVLSMVDMDSLEVAGKITVDDPLIVGLAVDPSSNLLYTGMRKKNFIAVIDRTTKELVAKWPFPIPITGAKTGMGYIAVDSEIHRLYCNSRTDVCKMVVFDTDNGNVITQLPINSFTDELMVDKQHKRLYVIAAGDKGAHHSTLEAFEQIDVNHWRSMGAIDTGDNAGQGGYIPEKNLIFVEVSGPTPAVQVYQIQ